MTFDPDSFIQRGTEVIPQAVKDATGSEDRDTVALLTRHLTRVAGCFGARLPQPVVFRESDKDDPLLPVAYAVMRRIADSCGDITVGVVVAAPEDGDGRDLRHARKYFMAWLNAVPNGEATNDVDSSRTMGVVRARRALDLSPDDFEEVDAAERADAGEPDEE